MKHLLLTQDIMFRKISPIKPFDGFSYNKKKGVWESYNKTLLILHQDFALMGSKKKDIETGEDQK